MAADYQDAVDEVHLDAAVLRLMDARALAPGVPLGDLALAIVRDMFCSCVATEPDASPLRPASIHAAVAAEVVARCERAAEAGHAAMGADHPLGMAPRQRFPAGGQAAWVAGRPARHRS